MNNFTQKIEKNEFDKVKKFFTEKNAVLNSQQYAVFKTNLSGNTVVLYESGKLVIQGSDVSELTKEILTYLGKEHSNLSEAQNICSFSDKPHIGIDESGKGDFFGPLVVGGVLVDETNRQRFIDKGIKDSKQLNDDKILKLANIIKANAIHYTLVLNNDKYNELYNKINNLNKLLAWGHARVIENILEKKSCEYALSDKFGKDELIENALMTKGKAIKLEQRCKGEEDIAVAAASIIARAEYVKRMESLSKRYEIDLPKGASGLVQETAKNFSEKYGKERLREVAKIHFKTYNQI